VSGSHRCSQWWDARTQLATAVGIHAGNGALNRVTELKRIKQGVSRLIFQNAYRGTRTSNQGGSGIAY